MIRVLLLAFPRAWRRRYGDELTQLIADTGLTPGVAVDLLRSGLHERALSVGDALKGGFGMTIGPAWRHPRGLALTSLAVLAPVLIFVIGSMLAYQLGVDALRGPLESINSWLATRRLADLALVVSPAVALALALAPLVRLDLRVGDGGHEAVFGIRLRLANVVVAVLAIAIGSLLLWHIVFESVMEAGA